MVFYCVALFLLIPFILIIVPAIEKFGYRESISFGVFIQTFVYLIYAIIIDFDVKSLVPIFWYFLSILSNIAVCTPITRFTASTFGP